MESVLCNLCREDFVVESVSWNPCCEIIVVGSFVVESVVVESCVMESLLWNPLLWDRCCGISCRGIFVVESLL